MSGPHPAGRSDIQVFRQEDGLKDKIPAGKNLLQTMGIMEKGASSAPPIRKTRNQSKNLRDGLVRVMKHSMAKLKISVL